MPRPKLGLSPILAELAALMSRRKAPEIHLKTGTASADACDEQMLQALRAKGIAC